MNKMEFIKPRSLPKENDFIWKYIDIHKFLSFIWQRRIRFTRMDQFEDPLEGIPYATLNKYISSKAGSFFLADFITQPGKYFMENEVHVKDRLRRIFDIQTSHYVSCWFVAQRESVAMWNLYLNGDGVALKIPFGKLKSTLKPDVDDFEGYYCGKVEYQDFRNTDPYLENPIRKIGKVALRKDLSFKHENELRFVLKKRLEKSTTGINSKILDLATLNFEVVGHPRMSSWKKYNIEQALKKIGLETSFKNSEIKLRE